MTATNDKDRAIQNYNTLPSNKRFGTFFAFIFATACIYGVVKEKTALTTITFGVLSILMGATTAINPSILTPLNRLWFKLGILLGKVVNPITLGAIFFLLLTPIAIITRLFGRDELKLNRKGSNTYWKNREPSGPSPDSFKRQY